MKKVILISTLLFSTNAYCMELKDFCLAIKNQDYDYLVANTSKDFYVKSKDDDNCTSVDKKNIKTELIKTAKDDAGFDTDGTSHIDWLKQENCDIIEDSKKKELMFGSFHLVQVKNGYQIDYVFQ